MAKQKVEYLTEPFYSNCFIEAVKAKVRHPLSIKITVVKRSEAGCPHFLWGDGKNDFDFGIEKQLTGLEKIWYKGQIRKRRLGFNERYKRLMQEMWSNRRRSKKCGAKVLKY